MPDKKDLAWWLLEHRDDFDTVGSRLYGLENANSDIDLLLSESDLPDALRTVLECEYAPTTLGRKLDWTSVVVYEGLDKFDFIIARSTETKNHVLNAALSLRKLVAAGYGDVIKDKAFRSILFEEIVINRRDAEVCVMTGFGEGID